MLKVEVSPSNSIIFISDVDGGETPIADKPDWIMATSSCISVGTLMEYDGETSIALAHLSELEQSAAASFDGIIATPTGQVVVSVVGGEPLLEGRSGSVETRILVWTNRLREPDNIVIGYERVPSATPGPS